MRAWLILFQIALILLLVLPMEGESTVKGNNASPIFVPILVYHRFGPAVADSMTVQTTVFESQLKYFIANDYTAIRLRDLVDYYLGKKPTLPPRPLVITVDDGHKSVYTDMSPLLKKYRIPVTLFIYPSAISNASYAMTWEELRALKEIGLFDFQSHTFWHPNFKKEKKRLGPAEYKNFIEMQLSKSKERLQKELNLKVDTLAWPFGIYDSELIDSALKTGYVAGLTLERHHANSADNIMSLPRYLIANLDGPALRRILAD